MPTECGDEGPADDGRLFVVRPPDRMNSSVPRAWYWRCGRRPRRGCRSGRFPAPPRSRPIRLTGCGRSATCRGGRGAGRPCGAGRWTARRRVPRKLTIARSITSGRLLVKFSCWNYRKLSASAPTMGNATSGPTQHEVSTAARGRDRPAWASTESSRTGQKARSGISLSKPCQDRSSSRTPSPLRGSGRASARGCGWRRRAGADPCAGRLLTAAAAQAAASTANRRAPEPAPSAGRAGEEAEQEPGGERQGAGPT